MSKRIFIEFTILTSFIPIILIFNFCYATGDDYAYGAVVKYAWENSHSIIEIIKASYAQVKDVYVSWQGTWFTVFLFAFNPEIFGFYYYIVPIIMLFLHFGAVWMVIKILFQNKFNIKKEIRWLICLFVLFCNIQFAPSYQCNLFWWVGTVHYVIPFFMGCLSFYNSRQFIQTYSIRSYIVACIAFALVGGGNYQIAVITPLLLLCSILWDKVIDRQSYKSQAKLLLLPVILEFIGLFISMAAPGNKNRGGESFGYSIGYAIKIVLQCFVSAFQMILEYCTERTILIALLFVYGFIMYRLICKNKQNIKYSFRKPLLMLVMTFCLFAASFAPELYANVGVSGGVYNTYFYIFIIVVCYDIAYLEGFFIVRKGHGIHAAGASISHVVCFLIFLVLVFIGRHSIKLSTAYVSYKYLASGQAEDYKEQMILQHQILTDASINDAVVPYINNEQGPLQQMPVTGDSDAWSNTVTADYYGKNSVVAIDRDEWILKYGSKYGY